jgi:hypothetical protein
VEHERRLREKITILSLMELISSLPPHQRTIALGTVAERTKLPLDGVEFLLMKVGGGRWVVVGGGGGVGGGGRVGGWVRELVFSAACMCAACMCAAGSPHGSPAASIST